MADVIVTEFMDEVGLEPLRKRFDVLYDPTAGIEPASFLRKSARFLYFS